MRQLEHHEVRNERRHHPIRLVCPGWRDPRNVGAAFRLADAAGLAGLLLTGSTPTPPNRKLEKTARSTVRHVEWAYEPDAAARLRVQRQQGACVVALEITDRSQSVFDYRLPQRVLRGEAELLLVTGAEDRGVPPEILAECEAAVHLPMFGVNTSMNVVMAAGVAVYWLVGALGEQNEGKQLKVPDARV